MVTLATLCHRLGGSNSAQRAMKNARRAQALLALFFVCAFTIVSGRIVHYGASANDLPVLAVASGPAVLAKNRPDIVDRYGRLLATDIRIYWLAANPKQIVNADDAAEKLAALFPDLNQAALAKKFRDKTSHFEWVKRGLTPKQAEAVHALGIPALTLLPTNQRVYPAGNEAAHILGITNVDNEGRSGVEWYIDQKLASQLTPTSLTGPAHCQACARSERAACPDGRAFARHGPLRREGRARACPRCEEWRGSGLCLIAGFRPEPPRAGRGAEPAKPRRDRRL